ncbi:MAG TPA: dTDP-4-dehydrorhamnose reductase [Candidatus Latescibacteria bacterium]|nr:dTDP-4-dehydrorhamnose reductase [Candidatus Latescibacterota bacterium]
MRVVVTGSTGLLGRKVLRTALGRGWDAVGISRKDAELSDGGAVRKALSKLSPDVVVHTAAWTDVDGCEKDRERAWMVNVEGTRHIAEACREFGAKVVYISTDYVFDGRYGPYGEEVLPHPLNYYGWTKLGGEVAVLSSSEGNLVVRTMVLYGWAEGVRSNFVLWLLENLWEGRRVKVVTDQWGNPTLADDLAEAVLDLLEAGCSGIVNYAGGDFWTRYEMALEVAGRLGVDQGLIVPVRTDQLGQVAKRPLRSGLKTWRAEEILGRRPMGFRKGLTCTLTQMGVEG